MATVTEREVEEYEDYELDDIADSFLDEQGEVVIAGIYFDRSQILKELDPIAYQQLKNELQEYKTIYECDECGCEYDCEYDAECCCEDEEDYEEDED